MQMKYHAGLWLSVVLLLSSCAMDNNFDDAKEKTDEMRTQEVIDEEDSTRSTLTHLFGETHQQMQPTQEHSNILVALWENICNTEDVSERLDMNGDSFGQEDLYILHTEEHKNEFYSVVMIQSEGPSLSLVQHSNPEALPVEILHHQYGGFPMSMGVHVNHYVDDGKTILWMTCKETRWVPETDEVIPNDEDKLTVELSDGGKVEYPVTPAETFIFFIPGTVISSTIWTKDDQPLLAFYHLETDVN